MTKKSILFSLFIAFISLTASADRVFEGFMTGSSEETPIPGYYRVTVGADTTVVTRLHAVAYSFFGGTYGMDRFYSMLSTDAEGKVFQGFCTYDVENDKMNLFYNNKQAYGCSDMTYDYSTKMIYGVLNNEAGVSEDPVTLVAIDPATGDYIKVATMSSKIMSIASSYFGDLYGISDNETLYRIDKVNGALTVVGSTSVLAEVDHTQSLDFDHETGELWWSCYEYQYIFGQGGTETARLIRLSTEDGHVMERIDVPNNVLMGSLHVPYEAAKDASPAAISDLTLSSDSLNVTLCWTNPTLTKDSSNLTSITKILIQREGKDVKEITGVQPGEKMTWTDTEIPDVTGNVRYVLYCYNEVGRGEGASKTVYKGYTDIPSPVTNLKATTDKNDCAVLTWDAPQAGLHGGQLLEKDLRYRITRMPGNVIDSVTTTTFVDEKLSIVNNYTYKVEAYNSYGESTADSVKVQAGKPITAPWATQFDNAFQLAQWTAYNINGDDLTWYHNSAGGMSCFTVFAPDSDTITRADDWLISVPMKLQANKDYILNVYFGAPAVVGSAEDFDITLGKGDKPEDQTTLLKRYTKYNCGDFDYTNMMATGEYHELPLKVTEDGRYNVGFHYYSLHDQFLVTVYYVILKEAPIKGDVNADGKVDVSDLTDMTRHILDDEYLDNLERCDLNGDDVVDVSDVTSLMTIILGN